jgi:hypothetical protein
MTINSSETCSLLPKHDTSITPTSHICEIIKLILLIVRKWKVSSLGNLWCHNVPTVFMKNNQLLQNWKGETQIPTAL